MKTLPEQYFEDVQRVLAQLSPDELVCLDKVAGKLSLLQCEYDLNTIAEYDAAIAFICRPPYLHPDEWLSLSEFVVMVFEAGAFPQNGVRS